MAAHITAQMVNELRGRTGVGLMDCKRALVESNGDFDEAITLLKKKGMATAAKKAGRDASEGTVQSYIHLGGKVGVMVELNCETDFVAKNDEFQNIAKGICMHIAASSPLYVSREEVPADLIEKEKDVARSQCEGKPENAIEKIVEGKIDKWFSEICLLEQKFVRNQDQTIQELLNENIAKLGENIVVRRFSRFQLGE
jgi:elongation factor Ts